MLSQFQKRLVATPEFSLFAFSSLRLLEEIFFKPLEVPVYKDFYQFNVYFCYICTKNWLLTIVLSKTWRGTTWILFICVVFMEGIKKKLKAPKVDKYLSSKRSFLLILTKRSTFCDDSFRNWEWHSLNFDYFCFLLCGY